MENPMRNPWIVAQLALAGVLLVLSAIGAIFPGLVLSLVVNALLMRAHRERGPSRVEQVLLVIEFVLIALLVLFHFYTDPAGTTFGLAIVTWPVIIVLAIAIAVVAIVRNATAPASSLA
jgi:hypothetical protein